MNRRKGSGIGFSIFRRKHTPSPSSEQTSDGGQSPSVSVSSMSLSSVAASPSSTHNNIVIVAPVPRAQTSSLSLDSEEAKPNLQNTIKKTNSYKNKRRPKHKRESTSHSRSRSFDSATSKESQDKSNLKSKTKNAKRHTAPAAPSIFQRIMKKISPKGNTPTEEEQLFKPSVSYNSDYTFTPKDLLLMDSFILGNFKKLDSQMGTLSRIRKLFLSLNDGSHEFVPTIKLVDDEKQCSIEKESWQKELKTDRKYILFVLFKKTKKIISYVADFSLNLTDKVLEVSVKTNSPLQKFFEPTFQSANISNLDTGILRELLLKQSLYPDHISVFETIAEAYETVACCYFTRSTLNRNDNKGLIGNVRDNHTLVGCFKDMQDEIYATAGEFIKKHQSDLLNYFRNKHRRSLERNHTSDTKSYDACMQDWKSGRHEPGDVLLVYDQDIKSWRVCCYEKGAILEEIIDKKIFNCYKVPQENKDNNTDEDSTETEDSDRSSESEKISPGQLGPDEMTEERVRELLNMIKMGKLFKLQTNDVRSITPIKEIKFDTEYSHRISGDKNSEVKTENTVSIDKQIDVKFGRRMYEGVTGSKSIPKRYDEMIIEFCKKYIPVFLELSQKNKERKLVNLDGKKEESPKPPSMFAPPPPDYENRGSLIGRTAVAGKILNGKN